MTARGLTGSGVHYPWVLTEDPVGHYGMNVETGDIVRIVRNGLTVSGTCPMFLPSGLISGLALKFNPEVGNAPRSRDRKAHQ